MTMTLRRTAPLAAILMGLAVPVAAPLLAQTVAPKTSTAPADPEMRLRRIEAEIRAMQRKVFPDRKSTRLNSSHIQKSRMPSSA